MMIKQSLLFVVYALQSRTQTKKIIFSVLISMFLVSVAFVPTLYASEPVISDTSKNMAVLDVKFGEEFALLEGGQTAIIYNYDGDEYAKIVLDGIDYPICKEGKKCPLIAYLDISIEGQEEKISLSKEETKFAFDGKLHISLLDVDDDKAIFVVDENDVIIPPVLGDVIVKIGEKFKLDLYTVARVPGYYNMKIGLENIIWSKCSKMSNQENGRNDMMPPQECREGEAIAVISVEVQGRISEVYRLEIGEKLAVKDVYIEFLDADAEENIAYFSVNKKSKQVREVKLGEKFNLQNGDKAVVADYRNMQLKLKNIMFPVCDCIELESCVCPDVMPQAEVEAFMPDVGNRRRFTMIDGGNKIEFEGVIITLGYIGENDASFIVNESGQEIFDVYLGREFILKKGQTAIIVNYGNIKIRLDEILNQGSIVKISVNEGYQNKEEILEIETGQTVSYGKTEIFLKDATTEKAMFVVTSSPELIYKDKGKITYKIPEFAKEKLFAKKKEIENRMKNIEREIKNLNDLKRIEEEKANELQRLIDNIKGYNFVGDESTAVETEVEIIKNEISSAKVSDAAVAEKIERLKNKFEKAKVKAKSEKFKKGIIPFKDTDDNQWFTEYVSFVKNNNIVSGYKDASGRDLGEFRPGNNITKAEILKIALESGGFGEGQGMPSNLKARKHWAKKYIKKAEDLKLDLFKKKAVDPDSFATRGEVIRLILEAFNIIPQGITEYGFPDTSKDRNASYIEYARTLGIINGYPDGTFRPDEAINRAEVAKIVKNAVEKLNK